MESSEISYIHETLLTTASEYFQTAQSSSFSEGQQKTCYLPEDDPRAFRAFVQYLYKEEYTVRTVWPFGEGGGQQSWFLLHADCFALENKLLGPAFKTQVVW